MYNSYTSLQREQLAKQTYTDTQSTYLLVYAPLRSRVLAQALQDQLHRKFRLVDHLAGELTDAVAGVLLVSEDVACLSTTLTYFAQALRDGADYAVCNAVFGFSGQTALYQSHGHLAENKFALVSHSLLARCRAAARDPESVTELLALAAQLCQAPVCIPQALLHYERDICAEDAYSASGKRAFVMSHVLDMTGAPIVLVSAVPVLRSMGYEVVVLGPDDSGSLQLFVDAGAAVITRAGCTSSNTLWGLALCADFVLANTVVEARVIRALSNAPVPVLWWLHDAFAGYPHIAHQIPKHIAPNVQLYSVGKHAAAAMHSVRPQFDIRLLPDAVREKATFIFVGKAADQEMMDAVRTLTTEHPANIFYCKRLSRDEIKNLMEQCTCLVCASRDDPMPTFVTEGLIFGKPSIVSEHTGTAGLITEGVDGFTYPDDDPEKLSSILEWAILHPEKLAAMRADCRKLYEAHYSKQSFADTLTAAVKELTEGH